jgi:Tol biopolymer transport system component
MSADGRRVVFLTFLTDDSAIQVFDGASASIQTLGVGYLPVINAAGTTVAFVDLTNNLAVVDIDTGHTTSWAVGPITDRLSVSADGSRIAFSSSGRDPQHNPQVFVLDVPTGVVTQLSSATMARVERVAISGDGARVVWAERYGPSILKTADLSTGDTRDLGYGYAPALAYDATRVAFIDEGGLQLLDLQTGVQRLLVTSDRGVGFPALAADGQRLVFQSSGDIVGANGDLDDELFVVDVATGRVEQVTNGSGNNGMSLAGISGDGTRVAFADARPLSGPNREGNSEVFVGVCGAPNAMPYEFGGFDAPLVADGSASIRKGAHGRTIPVAFQLRRAGEIVTTALASLVVQQVLDTATGTTDITDLTADAGQSSGNSGWFRYDPDTGRYVFSLSTKTLAAPGTYRIRVSLDDGSVHVVDFSLR